MFNGVPMGWWKESDSESDHWCFSHTQRKLAGTETEDRLSATSSQLLES